MILKSMIRCNVIYTLNFGPDIIIMFVLQSCLMQKPKEYNKAGYKSQVHIYSALLGAISHMMLCPYTLKILSKISAMYSCCRGIPSLSLNKVVKCYLSPWFLYEQVLVNF